MVQAIASAAEEQSSASIEIARSVEQINAITKQSADGARATVETSHKMQEQAEAFRELVNRFKV